MNELEFLEDWHAGQTDGDWEHTYGVRLSTYDNPAWGITVDIEETELEGVEVEPALTTDPDGAWVSVQSDGRQFIAVGGPRGLVRVLQAFREFVETGRVAAQTRGADGLLPGERFERRAQAARRARGVDVPRLKMLGPRDSE